MTNETFIGIYDNTYHPSEVVNPIPNCIMCKSEDMDLVFMDNTSNLKELFRYCNDNGIIKVKRCDELNGYLISFSLETRTVTITKDETTIAQYQKREE